MSNQLLGTVYDRIMVDVIENCQTTFEEDGVNRQTLDDMKSLWQTKLTAMNIGTFPWEPPPPPQPIPVPSNGRPQQAPYTGPPAPPMPVSSNTGPRVKTEPGYDPQGYQLNGAPSTYSQSIARERAAQALHQKFGANANLQINQLQAQAAMSVPGGQSQRSPMNIQLPPRIQEQQTEYQRMQQAQQYQPKPQPPQGQSVQNLQTDGAGEWDDYVAHRRLEASMSPEKTQEADLTIRQQVGQMNRAMEGGGLMMPLSEQPKHPQKKKRKVAGLGEDPSSSHSALVAAQSSDAKHMPRASQYDGGEDGENEGDPKNIKDELFDDDEDDEDAINSDLDDPDDNEIEEEPDEGKPSQIMLCTYDKVQRVKNKWKCVLRDGILNTGGKDYVFTKASGDFEW